MMEEWYRHHRLKMLMMVMREGSRKKIRTLEQEMGSRPRENRSHGPETEMGGGTLKEMMSWCLIEGVGERVYGCRV